MGSILYFFKILDCSFYLPNSRSMDKYARLMQKLEIVNVEFFKVSII